MLVPFENRNAVLKAIERIYLEAFPPEERRPVENLFAYATDPAKELCIIMAYGPDGCPAGFISYWDFADFVYVEHFAVDSSLRCSGTGSRMMQEFLSSFKVPVVLEVELPGMNPMADRRINFYCRLGFGLIENFDYIQPPYSPELPPVALALMSTASGSISPEHIRDTLHEKVYGVKKD